MRISGVACSSFLPFFFSSYYSLLQEFYLVWWFGLLLVILFYPSRLSPSSFLICRPLFLRVEFEVEVEVGRGIILSFYSWIFYSEQGLSTLLDFSWFWYFIQTTDLNFVFTQEIEYFPRACIRRRIRHCGTFDSTWFLCPSPPCLCLLFSFFYLNARSPSG